MLSDEELLIYEIAFHLGTSIYELSERPYEELLGWIAYFDVRPIGWREDDRVFKLLQAQGLKLKPEAAFPSLKVIYSPGKPKTDNKPKPADGRIDPKTFKGSSIFNRMLSASGGDKLDFSLEDE